MHAQFGILVVTATTVVAAEAASAQNGYPGTQGRYPLPGYPVSTRIPSHFYYLVAVHSTVQLWL